MPRDNLLFYYLCLLCIMLYIKRRYFAIIVIRLYSLIKR